jgi:hypothetical protein
MTNNGLIDDCRRVFEADAEPYGYPLEKDTCSCCVYAAANTEERWKGWQAAWEYLEIKIDDSGAKV